MPKFHARRITDAVHGTFGISAVEADIISTRVFQRLHNVKQLGLAYLVYPDLNYSRFAHSVGACHVVGRMVRAININCPRRKLSCGDRQLYRLAALLHDLGHYPFSHAMEDAVGEHYSDTLLNGGVGQGAAGADDDALSDAPSPASFRHENLGRRIIDCDNELNDVLQKHGISREDLKAAFSQEQPGTLVSLVSSDLDGDRIDYLMRTARHSGLPYGGIDAEYILGQTCVDSEGHVCFSQKALRAADHLLVSRYFDYTQVAFHKTVVAFEEVLKDVIRELLKRGALDCSGSEIQRKIQRGEFANFDDHFLIERLRQVLRELNTTSDESLKIKINAVLDRRPPKLVAACERIRERKKECLSGHHNLVHQVKEKIGRWAERSGVAEDLWHIWDKHLQMTKIGSEVPINASEQDVIEEEAAQGVRILATEPNDESSHSRLLVSHENALAKQLSRSELYMIRIYVHLTGSGEEINQKRWEIKTQIHKDLPYFPFTDV
jgi:HD superfamily phosphohydrolase